MPRLVKSFFHSKFFRRSLFPVIALFGTTFIARPALASSVSCAAPTTLVPDGRSLEFDNVSPATTVWYWFTATANRSYSIEVRDDINPDTTDLTVSIYVPGGTCGSLATATITDTTNVEPVVTTTSGTKRFSLVTNSTGNGVYRISVANASSTLSHYITATVDETTIYAPNWTSFGTWYSQFQIVNTTSQAITVTLTLIPTSGTACCQTPAPTTGAVAVPALSTKNYVTNATPLNVTSNQGGYAFLTYNGPPGAIITALQEVNPSSSPATFEPVPMAPLRGK